MNLNFDEIVDIFRNNMIWVQSREIYWYRKAWNALEKCGLNSYSNSIEKDLVMIKAHTLIIIFKEFCDLAFNEQCDYCFADWQEDSGVSDYRIGRIVGRFYSDEDFSHDTDYGFDLESIFNELVLNQRYEVAECIIENIGEYRESTAYVAMYLATFTASEISNYNNEEEHNDNFYTEENYEKYERDIERYFEETIEIAYRDDMEAYLWLSEGTYKVR